MKKLLLTLGLIGCTVASVVAQGTIAFGNNILSRAGIPTSDGSVRYLSPADGFIIGAFYGPAGSCQRPPAKPEA